MRTPFSYYRKIFRQPRGGLRLALLAAFFFAATFAQAVTNTWRGAGSDNTWTNAGNWFGIYAGSNTNQFTNAVATINFSTSTNTAGILVSGTASVVTITNAANTLNLIGACGVNVGAGVLAINVGNLTINSSQTWPVASGSALNVGANVSQSGFLLTVSNDDVATFNGTISGTSGLAKSGAGVLTLGVLNTYSGNTTVSAGTLGLNHVNALGTSTVLLTGGDLSVLTNLNSGSGVTNRIVNSTDSVISCATNFVAIWAGVITNDGTPHSLTFSSGCRTTTATNILNSANSWGDTVLSVGGGRRLRMILGVNDAFPTTGTVTNLSGAAGNVTVDFRGFSQTIAGLWSSTGPTTWTTSTGSSLLTINTASGADFLYSGQARTITGAVKIRKTGLGTQRIAGVNGNGVMTYTGGTEILGGKFVAGTNSVGTGAVAITNALLQVANSTSLTIKSNLLGDATGFIDLNGGTLTVTNRGSSVFAGAITNTGNLIKSGTGTLTLAGANTFVGTNFVSAGTLALGAGGSMSAAASVNIAAAATFDVSGLGASATYALGNSATLTASGTGTVVGTSAAAVKGGATGTINLGSRPIILTYDGANPALYLSQGTLSLNGNAFTVNSAAPLALGTYAIIQQASGNVISNGTFSVSGTALDAGAVGQIQVSGGNVNLVINSKPPHLTITSVNGGVNPVAGIPFSVTVQVQVGLSTPTNVLTDTYIYLSLVAGGGILGGNLSGVIPAGNNSVTISGVTYTKAESGVTLDAVRTSGDPLLLGNYFPFTVDPGAATTIALTSGNNQSGAVGTALANPFVATVTDAYGNLVSGTSVTFAVGTVPVGATGQSLTPTSAPTDASGQAASTLTLGSKAGTYTVTATSAGLNGSPVTFTAKATSGNYISLVTATNEYQICFKCHSGYAWLPGAPPNGNSPNGTAVNPVMTDAAQEFSPNNLSGHPIVTGLDNYPNSIVKSGKKGLLAAALKAPWNVNVGQQTMMCSDCHDASTASAVQGPHGSANQFILRGSNAANWPNVTSFSTSWCANCHNDTVNMDGHGNHHGAGGCNTCHIVIPHGGKMSRLIADADGNMPSRYALNNTISSSTVKVTSFTKSGTSYGNGACRTSCGGDHSSGSSSSMENW